MWKAPYIHENLSRNWEGYYAYSSTVERIVLIYWCKNPHAVEE
jgi:hypothetical protein